MSKMDNLRAMREARYEAASRAAKPSAAKPAAAPKKPAQPVTKRAEPKASAADPEAAQEELCGHRAISGRTCTREKGHSAKSHRYS